MPHQKYTDKQNAVTLPNIAAVNPEAVRACSMYRTTYCSPRSLSCLYLTNQS